MNAVQGRRIGTFEVAGRKLLVTDPCYDIGTWCQGVLENVHNGVWAAKCQFDRETGRISRLTVSSEGQTAVGAWEDERGFEVGVDSGQAGFFVLSEYPHGNR